MSTKNAPNQAIFTKRALRGNKVQAESAMGNKVAVPFDSDASEYESHVAAATALCEKLGWDGTLVAGGQGDKRGGGYVFVFSGCGAGKGAPRTRIRRPARRR